MAAANPAAQLLANFQAKSAVLDSVLGPSRLSAKYFQDLAGSNTIKTLMEQANRGWRAPYEELFKSLEHYKEPSSFAAFRSLAESLSKASRAAGFDQLNVDLTDAQVDPALRQRASDILHAIAGEAEGQPTLQHAVDQIIGAIEANKEPVVQKYLWLILVPFLLLLLNVFLAPIADFHIKKHLEASSKQEATKMVKEAAREAIGDVRLLTKYRFVTAQQLTVRSAAGARSPAIGQLRFGQLVQVLEKGRDFTLIAWQSEDGKAELHGWVFSRYLKRFN